MLAATSWGERTSFKLEYLFPTGSFKDRGTTVLVSELARLGLRRVMEDSSGNAGASLATYCARAGIACDVYVPASASAGKLAQVALAGANLIRVPGSREETTAAAHEAASAPGGPFYASHNWHPLFLEGAKTVGYEIWEQLGFRAPANIVLPVGNGSILLGLYRAFSDLRATGEVQALPRLFAIQAAECAPLVQAFHQGLDDVMPIEKGVTIAEGIASSAPIRGRQMLAALRESGGAALAVPEDAIMPELRRLAAAGFFVEPTSAVATAALTDLRSRGSLAPDEETIVILSGSGLKATDKLTTPV
jgi:threonine synthase